MRRSASRAAPGTGEGMAPIIDHPDVQAHADDHAALTPRRARDLPMPAPIALDMAHAAEGDEKRFWQERANLLTPIAKAFSPTSASRSPRSACRSMAAWASSRRPARPQLYRDARIAPIYEGTNGIQAIDLVTRKLPRRPTGCSPA
jgi:acyl-CoA dehydrogenase